MQVHFRHTTVPIAMVYIYG